MNPTSHVLARRWRPKTFETVVGQAPVLQALTHALNTQRLHHAYLFTGTRGVGKTTLARLFAKAVNCEQGISASPCGVCNVCTSIDAGRFVDLIEVDAASRTKVEDTRDLLDNVQYSPTQGRYKIYLIDEVHMLSGHSFNALLKTLEEPPSHVLFLLATTDPQKLPITVLSRCLQFHLKHVSEVHIASHLAYILDAESMPYEPEAIKLIAQAGQGSVRDALSLLDQAIAHGGGNVTAASVRGMLGALSPQVLPRLLAALAEKSGAGLLAVVEDVAQESGDFGQALKQLMHGLHDLALWQTVGDEALSSLTRFEAVQPWLTTFTPEDLQLYYQIALQGLRDLPFAASPRVGLQMVLLRMLAFAPVRADNPIPPSSPPPHRQIPAPQASPTAQQVVAPVVSAQQPPATKSQERVALVRAPQVQVHQEEDDGALPWAVEEVEEEAVPVKMEPPPTALETPVSIAVAPAVISWEGLLAGLKLNGMAATLASHCVMVSLDEYRLCCLLSKAHAPLFNKVVAARIEQAICEYLNQKIKLEIEIGEVTSTTPAENRARVQTAAWAHAKETLEADPVVSGLKSTLGAKVDESSISPADLP